MISFVRNSQTVFQSSCTILHSHSERTKVPGAPCCHRHWVVSVFWILAILIGVWSYLIIVWVFIFLMKRVKCIFTFLFALCVSSVVRCVLRPLTRYWIGWFVTHFSVNFCEECKVCPFVFCVWMFSCFSSICWRNCLCSTLLPWLFCQSWLYLQLTLFTGAYVGALYFIPLICD